MSTFTDKALKELRETIIASDARSGRLEDIGLGDIPESLVIARVKAQALLLLVEQVMRIADNLDEVSDQGSLAQSVAIHGSH